MDLIAALLDAGFMQKVTQSKSVFLRFLLLFSAKPTLMCGVFGEGRYHTGPPDLYTSDPDLLGHVPAASSRSVVVITLA